MPDRDSVINGLYEITHYSSEQMFYNDVFIRGIADDAITPLKEQDSMIEDARSQGWREGYDECEREY